MIEPLLTYTTWNIDFTLYTQEELEQLYEAVEGMDSSIANAISDYIIALENEKKSRPRD